MSDRSIPHPNSTLSVFQSRNVWNGETIITGITIFFLFSIILQYTLIPTPIAYVIISVSYVPIVLYFLRYDSEIEANSIYTKIYIAFSLVIYLRLLFEPTAGNTARLIAFFTFTSFNMYLLPYVVPFYRFTAMVARLSMLLIFIGFLPYLGSPVRFGFVDLSLWEGRLYWYEGLNPITSVFHNPNQLGGLALVGSIAAVHEYLENSTTISKILFVVNFAGLLMTNWRTGWVILIVSVWLYLIYLLWGRYLFSTAVMSFFFATIVGLLVVLNAIPGPNVISNIPLGNRRPRWATSIQAILNRPLLGYGFTGVTQLEGNAGNPHNSFIRIFAVFGIFGGLLYVIITIGTAVGCARRSMSYPEVTLSVLLTGFFILQMFNQLSFIGLSMRSTFISVMIGYYLTGEIKRNH